MTEWMPVSFAEVYRYLGVFIPRGEGEVRDRLVRTEQPVLYELGTTISMDVSHPERGRFRLTLTDVEVLDDDTRQWRPACADDLDTLKRCPFDIHDAAGHYYGTPRPVSGRLPDGTAWKWPGDAAIAELLAATERTVAECPAVSVHFSGRNIFGYYHHQWRASSCTVERSAATYPDGACPGCGSTAFVLQCRASIPVEADGKDSLRLVGDVTSLEQLVERIVFGTAFTKVRCGVCTLEQTTRDLGRYEGAIGGVEWSDREDGKARLSAATLWAHLRGGSPRR